MTICIYLDTSAVAKLFLSEKESPDLRKWLSQQFQPRLVSSALMAVELIRLLDLVNTAIVRVAQSFLAVAVDIVEVTPPILENATHVSPARLRTLDAIHLATALDLGKAVDVILTYDKLLAEAARTNNLRVVSPGIV